MTGKGLFPTAQAAAGGAQSAPTTSNEERVVFDRGLFSFVQATGSSPPAKPRPAPETIVNLLLGVLIVRKMALDEDDARR